VDSDNEESDVHSNIQTEKHNRTKNTTSNRYHGHQNNDFHRYNGDDDGEEPELGTVIYISICIMLNVQ
jgi:hypothetical protein